MKPAVRCWLGSDKKLAIFFPRERTAERRRERKMLRFLRPNERCHLALMLSSRKWVLMKLHFRNWNRNVLFPEFSFIPATLGGYIYANIPTVYASACKYHSLLQQQTVFLQSSHFICLFSHQAPSEFSSSLRAISVLPHHFMTIVFAFAPVFSPLGIWTEIEIQRGAKKFLHVWISRLPPTHLPRAADAQPISPDGACVTELSKVFFCSTL